MLLTSIDAQPHPGSPLQPRSAFVYIILSFQEQLSAPLVKSSMPVAMKAGQSPGLQKEATDIVKDPFNGSGGESGILQPLTPPGLSLAGTV